MYWQLELWPTSIEESQPPEIWQNLTDHEKRDLVVALAGLIGKMVSIDAIDQTEEDRHER